MSDTRHDDMDYAGYDDTRTLVLGLMMTDCHTRHTGVYPCMCWESSVEALDNFEKAVRLNKDDTEPGERV